MKKNSLDKLYQEKFSEFHELPDVQVWKRIEASLDKKAKKRVIPIWWYAGGVAALLIVGLLLFSPSSTNNLLDKQPVADVEEQQNATSGPKENNQVTTTINTNKSANETQNTVTINQEKQEEISVAKQQLTPAQNSGSLANGATKAKVKPSQKKNVIVPKTKQDALAVVPNNDEKDAQYPI